jgi:hypothetical protein
MTPTHTAYKASLLRRLGTLMVVAWSGEHIGDGGSMALLMVYSLGDGIEGPSGTEAAVLAAAEDARLPVGGAVLDVAQAYRNDIKVLAEADKAVLTMPYVHMTCPVPAEWTAAARLRGSVYVILASRPWPAAVPGYAITVEALRAFAGDEDVLRSAAHMLVPLSKLRS